MVTPQGFLRQEGIAKAVPVPDAFRGHRRRQRPPVLRDRRRHPHPDTTDAARTADTTDAARSSDTTDATRSSGTADAAHTARSSDTTDATRPYGATDATRSSGTAHTTRSCWSSRHDTTLL